MIPTARLIIRAATGELEDLRAAFDAGSVMVMLEAVELEADAELLRHDLSPHLLIPVSCLGTTEDLPDARSGPLVRVYATHPAEEHVCPKTTAP